MKILHVIDSLSMGGAETLVCILAINQKKLGEDVTVVQIASSNSRNLEEQLDCAGIKRVCLEFSNVYNPLAIVKLIPYLRNADVINVHLFPAMYWAGFAKLFGFSSTPMVFTEHSTFNRRRDNRLLLGVDYLIYRCCYKEVIACADKVLETFKEKFPRISTSSIPNGVDTIRFKNANPYSKKELWDVSEDVSMVTMVARFADMKRQDVLIDALPLLPDAIHVAFVGGDGGCLCKAISRAESIGVADRVHFMGIRSDVPRILKSSDIICMSSDYEGLSLSSIEGMAIGKPFVASNVNGLREVVGGAGVLFENGNAAELAGIINKLLLDKEYYSRVSSACQERSKDYDISEVVIKYKVEYLKFVKNRLPENK